MKRLKLRKLFMICGLAVAGLFGIGSGIIVNNPNFKKAVASEAEVTPDYVYLKTIIAKQDTWYDSMMGNTKMTSYKEKPWYGNAEVIGTSFPGALNSGTKTVCGKTYARFLLTKNAELHHVVFTNGDGGNAYKRTDDKLVPTLLDTYVLDYQGSYGVDYSSGYWTKQIYVDITDSGWSATTSQLQIEFYKNSSWSTSGYTVNMTATDTHCGFSYSNNMAFAEIPKDGDTMSNIPTQARIRIQGTSDADSVTVNFDLKHNSNYVYKVKGYNNGSSRKIEPVSLDNYTVSFDTGDLGTPASQSVPYGTTDVSVPTPVTGFEYDSYWYKNAGKSTYWTFGTDVIREDTTIYGTATPIDYDISYTLNGGTASNQSTYTIIDDPITLNNPTKTGYTFTGWTGSNGSTPQTTVTIPTGSYGDKSYTANYTINYYTVTWKNYNGEILETDYVPYGSTPSYDQSDPDKPSDGSNFYTFTGWSPSPSTVSDDVTYTAQFSVNTTKTRFYFYNGSYAVDADPHTSTARPFLGTDFNSTNQTAAVASISASTSQHIPASGNSVCNNWHSVKDIAFSSSGQNWVFLTFFQNGGWSNNPDRFIPWRGSQSYSSLDGIENSVGQDDSFSTPFKNGYIYKIETSTYKGDYGNGKDTYDNWNRNLKWFAYNISTEGVFVHFDLDGGTHPSVTADIEHKINTNLTLPSAPTKTGYTFMGWEASNNGILNRASTSFNVKEPMSFKAIWHSNTIQVVGGDKVRVWVGYNCHDHYLSSLMYNGLGYSCRIFAHQNASEPWGDNDLVAATGTYYNTTEDLDSDFTNCPRRYDYFDIPSKYFTGGGYLTLQRFNSSGTWENQTTNLAHLASSNNYSFKVLYIDNDGDHWYFSNDNHIYNENIDKGYGLASTDAMFAAISLAGIHSCSNDLMNGNDGFNNWKSTFLQSVSPSSLASYTIIDFEVGHDYTDDRYIDYSVDAYHKYSIIDSQVSGTRSLSLGYLNGLFGQGEDSPATLIIIIASSISLLSITALSVLVIKKRKTK